jgi:hypothetical protein
VICGQPGRMRNTSSRWCLAPAWSPSLISRQRLSEREPTHSRGQLPELPSNACPLRKVVRPASNIEPCFQVLLNDLDLSVTGPDEFEDPSSIPPSAASARASPCSASANLNEFQSGTILLNGSLCRPCLLDTTDLRLVREEHIRVIFRVASHCRSASSSHRVRVIADRSSFESSSHLPSLDG